MARRSQRSRRQETQEDNNEAPQTLSVRERLRTRTRATNYKEKDSGDDDEESSEEAEEYNDDDGSTDDDDDDAGDECEDPGVKGDGGKDSGDGEEQAEEDTDQEESSVPSEPAEADAEAAEGLEVCAACKEPGRLLLCDICPRMYHLTCLDPPLKSVPRGTWSCPQCQNPLTDLEKVLDSRVAEAGDDKVETKGKKRALKKEYLVKWKSRSHMHCSWVPQSDFDRAASLNPGVKLRLNNYWKHAGERRRLSEVGEPEEPIRNEWTTVDRVIASRQTADTGTEYLVKWKELGYEEATWEKAADLAAFRESIAKFEAMQRRESKAKQPPTRRRGAVGSKLSRQKQDFDETPPFLKGGVLHPYQLEGLDFLRKSYRMKQHIILADEMGLGKTIQAIAFLASLFEEGAQEHPHLIVAPLSTLRNWEREFALWAPQLNVVLYVGTAAGRKVIRDYEFYFPAADNSEVRPNKRRQGSRSSDSRQRRIKFDVLLASYEMVNVETSSLRRITWQCLVVDEGHRLKNKASKLFQTLTQFESQQRVLLTGTPLQNNLDELFVLMHFLDATKFHSLEEFQDEFRDLNQEEQVGRLHKMLAPHLLRRLKKDVLTEMPPKKELIVRVELSPLQRTLYKAVLTRNYEALSRSGNLKPSLANVVMELRKVCGHPFLFEGMDGGAVNTSDGHRNMTEASGKLALLDKMLAKLKERGHRVLVYSQFTRILDIVEDWVIFKKWRYERIDGSINGVERQIRIDRFNAPNSADFCFLLSTRAGGLGINLATADTVVIYDSDWNPHADFQAMARAHRLGQKGTVMIYRLITRGTIEERMMQLTKKKMVLEHLVVGRMKIVMNQGELDDIIRFGAKELFEEMETEDGKKRQIHYDDAAIDRLLDRSQVVAETSGEEADNPYLDAFKVANFEYMNEAEAAAAANEEEAREAAANAEAERLTAGRRAEYWHDLLKDKFTDQQIRTFEELGKGKRARKQVDYKGAHQESIGGTDSEPEEDNNDREAVVGEESESSSDGGDGDFFDDDEDFEGLSARRRKRAVLSKEDAAASAVAPPLAPGAEAPLLQPTPVAYEAKPPPLMEGQGADLKVLGFNRKQRNTFIQILLRYGLGDMSWTAFVGRLRPKTLGEIKEYGSLFLSHISEELTDGPTFKDGVPKDGLQVREVLVRLATLHLVRQKVEEAAANPGRPLLMLKDNTRRFLALRRTKVWGEVHDLRLLRGLLKHGYGRWHDTVHDAEFGLQPVLREELILPQPPSVPQLPFPSTPPPLPPQPPHSTPTFPMHPMAQNFPWASPPGSANPLQGRFEWLSAWSLENAAQKKMVEFVKKRVQLLLKALDKDYHNKQARASGKAMASDSDGSDGENVKGGTQRTSVPPPPTAPSPHTAAAAVAAAPATLAPPAATWMHGHGRHATILAHCPAVPYVVYPAVNGLQPPQPGLPPGPGLATLAARQPHANGFEGGLGHLATRLGALRPQQSSGNIPAALNPTAATPSLQPVPPPQSQSKRARVLAAARAPPPGGSDGWVMVAGPNVIYPSPVAAATAAAGPPPASLVQPRIPPPMQTATVHQMKGEIRRRSHPLPRVTVYAQPLQNPGAPPAAAATAVGARTAQPTAPREPVVIDLGDD